MGLFDRLFGRSLKQERWSLVQKAHADRGVVYSWAADNGTVHPLGQQPPNASGTDRLLAARLELLADEGLLNDGALPFSTIAEADQADLSALRLAVSQGWQAEARPKGAVGRKQPDVQIHWHAPDGEFFLGTSDRFEPVDCGFWDHTKQTLHILPAAMLKMRRLVAEQPRTFTRVSDEYGFLQQVQMLAEEGTELSDQGRLTVDQQLRNETYIVPRGDEVQVEVREQDDGRLVLSPTMPGHDSFELGRELLEHDLGEVVTRLTGPNRQGRQRIVHPPEVLDRIRAIRAVPTVEHDDVPRFIKDPAAFIKEQAARTDPTLDRVVDEMDFGRTVECLVELDLTSYGPRVAGEVEYEARQDYDPQQRDDDPSQRVLLPQAPIPAELPKPEDQSKNTRPQQRVLETTDNLDEVKFAAETAQALRKAFSQYPIPESFEGTLFPHQEEGYVWLRRLWDGAVNTDRGQGGLLADEMGLGKTVQVAALLAHLQETGELRPAAIVAPAAVTHNWVRELNVFVPSLRILVHEGSNRTSDPEVLVRSDVVIVTYDTLTRDQKLFALIPFNVLVLDEAHYVKNHGVKRARACRAMDAKLRLALTATPVENRLEELWAVTDFAQPGLLGSLRTFCWLYVRPIDAGAADANAARTLLLKKLGAHYLRRTKKQVLNLPEKTIEVVKLPMAPQQYRIYNAVLRFHTTSRQGALAAIHDLVRVSAHPAAVENIARSLGVEDAMAALLTSPESLISASPKFAFIMSKLDAIRDAGEKAVIFTSIRAVQPILQVAIYDRYGFRPVTLTGSDSPRRRNSEIQRFNANRGFDVLVLSTQAVGLGVNITGANHVFHLTREWNPSKEDQATDRVHRIGQTKPVHVWIPIITRPDGLSIDARIEQLMVLKGALTDSVIRPSAGLNFSEKELEVALDLDDT